MTYLAYARIADQIRAANLPCHIGDPPDNIPVPYTFVWGPLPIGNALTLAGADDVLDLECNVQVVAETPATVLKVADQVKGVLQGAELVLDGYRVFPLKVTGSTSAQTARSVANEETNTYPAWLTLHLRLQATKENC